MNPTTTSPSPRILGRDKTVRWSCRAGEFVLLVRTNSFLTSDRPSAWKLRDFWQMRDGDFVTITNRWADLPPWFQLYTSEVAGAAVYRMIERLNAGYKPTAPMEGPNIWRARAGDRLVWVTTKDPRQPVRELLDLHACVAAIGENSTPSFQGIATFGAPASGDPNPEEAAAIRVGFAAAAGLGVPRTFTPEWGFGA